MTSKRVLKDTYQNIFRFKNEIKEDGYKEKIIKKYIFLLLEFEIIMRKKMLSKIIRRELK